MSHPGGRLVLAALAAAAAHGGALTWLALLQPPPPPVVRAPPVRVRLAARPPAPAPPVEPPPPAPKPPPPAPRPARAPEPPRLARAEPAEPPRQAAPPPLPSPRRFAVSLEATVSGGGVAVPVTEGPTAARGRADLPASAPVGDNEGATAVDLVEVERAPQLLSQPSPAELRALYPDAARREQLEMDVALRLLVDASGRVAEIRVMKAAGHGFDEAATAAARDIRFRPGQRGGKAVAVWIPWTLKFRLDG